MSASSRGAANARAILAGTLSLASIVAMSGPAARRRNPAPAVASLALGSAPRATEVRPADMGTRSTTPAPTLTAGPTASPTAQAGTAPTTQPVAVATPRRSEPTPTPPATGYPA